VGSERMPIAMRIEIREANTSTPERPLWVWHVFWGSREVGKGFSPSEKEASKEAKLAISRSSRPY
jgi:dsRNA-specific ribonuclease